MQNLCINMCMYPYCVCGYVCTHMRAYMTSDNLYGTCAYLCKHVHSYACLCRPFLLNFILHTNKRTYALLTHEDPGTSQLQNFYVSRNSTRQHLCLSICLSIYLSIYLSICLSIFLSFFVSTRKLLYPPTHPHTHTHTHIYVYI